MKKILSTLTVFAVIMTMVFALSTEVAAASGNLSGPNTIEKGKTFTVSYTINTTDCQGINANFSFNSSELKLNSVTDNKGANVDYANGSLFLDTMSSPITGSSKILNFSFTALGAINTKATFKLTGISITENYNEVPVSDASYTVTVSAATISSSTPTASSSKVQSSTQQPAQSKPASTTTQTPSSTTNTTASTSTGSSNTSSTSSVSSVSSISSETVSSEISDESELNSTIEDSASEIEGTEKEDTTKKSNKKTVIIVVICVLVLCGAIGVLLYIKNKKN